MRGYAELLRDGAFGELPEKSAHIVDRLQVNGRHLLGPINTVLDISKIEAGQFTLNLAKYSLTSPIETVRCKRRLILDLAAVIALRIGAD